MSEQAHSEDAMPNSQQSRQWANDRRDDASSVEDRLAHTRRLVDIMGVHQEHLASQIGELVVCIRGLAQKQDELTEAVAGIEKRIPELMAQGIVNAVGNPATWQAGRDAMKAEARQAAGGWVLGVIRFALNKIMWGLAFLAAVYWVGGAPALLALLKARVT
jgi:peptidoglycan hydrolase CwlO-like protein